MAAVNMTEGGITKHLVDYSIPLILGNMFQLTYNAVDSIIAGRFIGKEALAAEGTASPVMNIVILGISGICMGASVLMSEFYGAGQKEKLKREMSTTVIFGCYFSVLIAILEDFSQNLFSECWECRMRYWARRLLTCPSFFWARRSLIFIMQYRLPLRVWGILKRRSSF